MIEKNKGNIVLKSEEEILSVTSLKEEADNISHINELQHNNLDNLTERVKKMYQELGQPSPEFQNSTTLTNFTHQKEIKLEDYAVKGFETFNNVDYVMTGIAGGIAVIVDFLIVKFPKEPIESGKLLKSSGNGSPLTKIFRNMGFDSQGNVSPWINKLEKYFHVNYDKSVIKGEKVFCPNTHRLMGLAHDPSPFGFLIALKDMINGTMTFIDKNGIIKTIPTKKTDLKQFLIAPVVWIGHLISDLFTKAGIPIPGWSLLQVLQFGSFGEKKRTIAEVARYMYLEGYDLRHLATMSTCNAIIEIILRIYFYLTKEPIKKLGRPTALIQSDQYRQKLKLIHMREGAYAIAWSGNVTKLAVNGWNPLALNLPIWIEFLRLTIEETRRQLSPEKIYFDIIKNRESIEMKFDYLENLLEEIKNHDALCK